MTTYKTPGVYTEEISTLPPSVAEVSTAIPAFIGCTENGPSPDAKEVVVPVVTQIDTLLDFQTEFGGLWGLLIVSEGETEHQALRR